MTKVTSMEIPPEKIYSQNIHEKFGKMKSNKSYLFHHMQNTQNNTKKLIFTEDYFYRISSE